jgi:hypothetical protein
MHYIIEQKTATQGIRMSRRVEPILVTKQEIILLPRVEPTVAECVHVAVRMKYSEPIFNQ